MDKSRFTQFAETLKGVIEYCTKDILNQFRLALEETEDVQRSLLDDTPFEMITKSLFQSVFEKLAVHYQKDETSPAPEATMAELIRRGVPREDVLAEYRHVTAFLPNGCYSLYRATSGKPSGTIECSWKHRSATIQARYSSEDLAEFIMLVDEHIPAIETAAEALTRALEQEILQWQTRQKALEIAKKSVKTLLSGVLPGLSLGCTYTISGDKVHLDFTRILTASVDLPLQELSEFLSDPARIESTLEAVPSAEIKETTRITWQPTHIRSPFPSNITHP